MTRQRPHQPAGERGSVTVFLLAMVPVALLLIGMAYDPARAFVVHTRAVNLAEQAARQGAQQVDIASVRAGGDWRLDRPRALQAARAFLAGTGQRGQVRIVTDPATGTDAVQVQVRWSVPTVYLGIVGKTSFAGTGEATARNAHGVITEDPEP
jgi:hypothetical protein